MEMLTSVPGHSLRTISSKYLCEKVCNHCIGNRNIWLLKKIIAYFRMLKECPEGTR